MYNFDQAPSVPQSPVPPALADLMQVASMQTPEGQPTVAAQYAAKAVAPQMPQGTPQGMPQGMPSAGPSMQGIAQNVARGNEVQATQQQQQQQAMQQMLQQMLQQQQGRDNAMRFGVAAAPGAQTVRMAEGGIVGYAEGDLTSERLARIAAEQAEEEARTRAGSRFDPRTPEEAREMAQRRAAAQARLNAATAAPEVSPAAATATEGRGVGSLLRRVGGRLLGPAAALYPVYEALKTPESRAETEDFFRGVLGFGPANRPDANYSNEGRNALLERQAQENYSLEGRNYPAGSSVRSGIGQTADQAVAAAVAAAQRDMQPPAPPRAGISALQAPTASAADRGAADAEFNAARRALAGLETTRTAPADLVKKLEEQQAAYAPYLRAQGVDPEQYKKDLATSEERKARRLSGLASLEAQSQEARSGTNRIIEFLAGGAGRFLPGGLGQQHVNMLRRDLAENERFLNARERVMEAEDTIQASIREKRRAEVMGDIKAMETAELKDREARNAQRIAQADLSKEIAKAYEGRVEKALDRNTQIAIENLRSQVHREATAAQQAGTLEVRRGQYLTQLTRAEEIELSKADDRFQKRVTALGILPGAKPTPDQVKSVEEARAEFDLAKADIRRRFSDSREVIMSMGSGGGSGGIKVERVK